jgi:hypothetical protein
MIPCPKHPESWDPCCSLCPRENPYRPLSPSANEQQVGGDHYKGAATEPWDYILQHNLGYLEGNIIKYVTRHTKKNGLEDLKKAQHYLQKLIEHESKRAN